MAIGKAGRLPVPEVFLKIISALQSEWNLEWPKCWDLSLYGEMK